MVQHWLTQGQGLDEEMQPFLWIKWLIGALVNVGSFWRRNEEKPQRVLVQSQQMVPLEKLDMTMVLKIGIDYYSTHIIISFLSIEIPKSHLANWISFINAQVLARRVQYLMDVGKSFLHIIWCLLFAKIWPKKYDFNLYKGFSMEKMVQICPILKEKTFRSLNFYDKFQ